MAHPDWKSAARADIDSVSSSWDQQFGWNPQTVEGDEHIDVFVTLRQGEKRYLLRLRYQQDFQRVGRRGAFCDPRIPDKSGQHYWPSGNAFKSDSKMLVPQVVGERH